MKSLKQKKLENLLKLCKDFQVKAHLGKVTNDVRSLSFSCDLLLRNMIMIIEKEKNGKDFTEELNYLTNNVLGAHSHLTEEDAESTALKYNITSY